MRVLVLDNFSSLPHSSSNDIGVRGFSEFSSNPNRSRGHPSCWSVPSPPVLHQCGELRRVRSGAGAGGRALRSRSSRPRRQLARATSRAGAGRDATHWRDRGASDGARRLSASEVAQPEHTGSGRGTGD